MYSNEGVVFIDEKKIVGKRVLLRCDFNISLLDNVTIADDARIRQAIPTITHLLSNGNRLILVSHLNRPQQRTSKHSLRPVADHLQTLLPGYRISLLDDFLSKAEQLRLKTQTPNEVFLLENIRFYAEEKENDRTFAKKLAELADVYVNDAFGVSHRENASIMQVPHFLPAYGGLLLKKEIKTIGGILTHPKKPLVAIIGGAKISTKIHFIDRLLGLADTLLLGGGLADTLLKAKLYEIGKSIVQKSEVEHAKQLLSLAVEKKTEIVLPVDAVVGTSLDTQTSEVKKIEEIPREKYILDIGPKTEALFGSIIARAKTIVWNGPLGYFENPNFRRGTDFIYYAIAQNKDAKSIVGGGATLAAISKKEYLEKITHISTGGGAMLEFIENGTLPGIEALKISSSR